MAFALSLTNPHRAQAGNFAAFRYISTLIGSEVPIWLATCLGVLVREAVRHRV